MPSYLSRPIEYHDWANHGLLESLSDLLPETLDLTADGVYGTIRETLEHLLSSELSYTRRLAARGVVDLPERPEHPDLAVLQRLPDESAADLAALMRSLPEPDEMIQLGDGGRAAATTMLTQLFVHGDDWPPACGPEPAERS